MRNVVIALSLLAAVSAFGQVRVSGFRTGPDNGWGGAVEVHATPHWAVELAAARSGNQQLTIGGIFTGHIVEFRTSSIDLTAHYSFVNATRWQPFIGAGAHRATTSSDEVEDRTSAEIDGGVHFMITPNFSLRISGRGILNDDHSYDPGFKSEVGLAWKF
jgi:outer membrane protein W